MALVHWHDSNPITNLLAANAYCGHWQYQLARTTGTVEPLMEKLEEGSVRVLFCFFKEA